MKLFCWHKWRYIQGYVSTDYGDFVGVNFIMKVCTKCGYTTLHEVCFSYGRTA